MRFDPIRSGLRGVQEEEETPEAKRRWSEGIRRHEAIRNLIERHPGLLKVGDVRDVAWDIGVSQATLDHGLSRHWNCRSDDAADEW